MIDWQDLLRVDGPQDLAALRVTLEWYELDLLVAESELLLQKPQHHMSLDVETRGFRCALLDLCSIPDRAPLRHRLRDGVDDHSLRLGLLQLSVPSFDEDCRFSLECRSQCSHQRQRHVELVCDLLVCQLLRRRQLCDLDPHVGVQIFHSVTSTSWNVCTRNRTCWRLPCAMQCS